MPPSSVCYGCGETADIQPYVGVARDDVTGKMTAYPICLSCWRDPTHRTRPLKMHFFSTPLAAKAVDAAEKNIMVSPAGTPATPTSEPSSASPVPSEPVPLTDEAKAKAKAEAKAKAKALAKKR